MTQSITFKGHVYTEADIAARSGSGQAMLYNIIQTELGIKNLISKFSDKVTGTKRTWALLQQWAEKNAPVAKKEKPTPMPKNKTPRVGGVRKTRIMRFTFAPDEEITTLKDPNTLRGRCVVLLKQGATFEQVKELVLQFDKDTGRKTVPEFVGRRAYELVRILHYHLGYGIKHDIESGIIQLTTKK